MHQVSDERQRIADASSAAELSHACRNVPVGKRATMEVGQQTERQVNFPPVTVLEREFSDELSVLDRFSVAPGPMQMESALEGTFLHAFGESIMNEMGFGLPRLAENKGLPQVMADCEAGASYLANDPALLERATE